MSDFNQLMSGPRTRDLQCQTGSVYWTYLVWFVNTVFSFQDVEAATELARIMGQFTEKEEALGNPSCNKGDELLAMMDELS